MHPDFKKNGYLVARNFFDNTTVALMQTYFDFKHRIINFSEENRIKAGKSEQGPGKDVAPTFGFYSDQLIESVHLNYGQKASETIRMSLSPTYTFTRIYERGDSLLAHTDRPSCEISMTCPILTASEVPSTIYISNYVVPPGTRGSFTPEEIEKRGDYSEVNLYPGDALFYSGCERFHWRRPLDDDYLIQFFLHFVETDGKYKDWYFDKRPYSGFPSDYKGV
jgi:hypothetical protein